VASVHVDPDGTPVAHKEFAVATGGVEQALSRVGNDPAYQRPGDLRRSEELPESLLCTVHGDFMPCIPFVVQR
jgi:hypothetical protein